MSSVNTTYDAPVPAGKATTRGDRLGHPPSLADRNRP